MRTSIKDVFRDRPYPRWITGHAIFEKERTIQKVFPSIGLPNCTDNQMVDNSDAARRSAASLLTTIQSNLLTRVERLSGFGSASQKIGKARRTELTNISELLGNVAALIGANKEACTVVSGTKITLKLPADVCLTGKAKPTFRAEQGILRVYGQLNDMLARQKFARMPAIDQQDSFKQFSVDNMPARAYQIRFSSSGPDGVWDIATMSQRGIKTCQSWDEGQYKHCVIGSMIDPFVGIIYLTDGKSGPKYGCQMLKRCIVRYVVDAKKRTPYLSLDSMYPSFDTQVLNRFIAFLKQRVGEKISVEYGPYLYGKEAYQTSYIPLTKVRKRLAEHGSRGNHAMITAYQDVRFEDKEPGGSLIEPLYAKNAASKVRRFEKGFIDAAVAAIRTIDEGQFPENVRSAVCQLKGTSRQGDNAAHHAKELMRWIANAFVTTVDASQFTNSDTYIRRVYYNYFNRRGEVFDGQRARLTTRLNQALILRGKRRLRPDHLTAIMQVVLGETDRVMKTALRTVVARRKTSGALPLPSESKPVPTLPDPTYYGGLIDKND